MCATWDLVGNDTPVFFTRDPLKFPDLIHEVKRDPRINLRSAKNQLGFLDITAGSLAPRSRFNKDLKRPEKS